MSERYAASEAMLEQALKVIPLGTQTFSKSKTQYPFGASPYFVKRGRGSRIWDVDGNEYIDFASSLGAINLGYNDEDVVSAVRAQLDEGTIFSLPHPIEIEVAELLKEMVPCAESTRFGKNGSDATAGAIRVARAYTGRERVAACGYHGWQDWYIGSTARHKGVPKAVRELTSTFTYNDVNSLAALFEKYPDQIAAVILEPMNTTQPKAGFFESVQQLARKNGALLIFDETITGFRFANGGAQEVFGVTPDLATFGKGIANGYPLSAICGSARIMKEMEEIFFSFTYGGETLSLAAAKATLLKLRDKPVIASIRKRGVQVMEGVKGLIEKHGVGRWMSISGDPTWSFLNIEDCSPYSKWQLKTLFLQEIFARGVLTLGSHMITYAHEEKDVEHLLATYDQVFPLMENAIQAKDLEAKLKCIPLEPLFKVR